MIYQIDGNFVKNPIVVLSIVSRWQKTSSTTLSMERSVFANHLLRCLDTFEAKSVALFDFLKVTPLKTREVNKKYGISKNRGIWASFFTVLP